MRGLWLDERIGKCLRWVLCDSDELMQLPPELRKCVWFLHGQRPGDPWMGTGFFVQVKLSDSGLCAFYAVTARHCIDPDDADEYGPAESIGIRLNTRAGGSDVIWTKPGDWRGHPTADVAVLSLCPDQLVFDWLALDIDMFATSEFVRTGDYGPGEDLLITGLLVHHPGETRIMPITRVGNVAAFPDEPILVHNGVGFVEDVVAFAEVRSIGGLSGSPVFLHPGDVRTGGGAVRVATSGLTGGPNYLLGLIHGIYEQSEENDPQGIVPRPEEETLSTGIAVVVLADRILDLINSPQEVAMRKKATDELRQKKAPRPTSAHDDGSQEFEQFENLTRKLVNTPKPKPDEDKS